MYAPHIHFQFGHLPSYPIIMIPILFWNKYCAKYVVQTACLRWNTNWSLAPFSFPKMIFQWTHNLMGFVTISQCKHSTNPFLRWKFPISSQQRQREQRYGFEAKGIQFHGNKWLSGLRCTKYTNWNVPSIDHSNVVIIHRPSLTGQWSLLPRTVVSSMFYR